MRVVIIHFPEATERADLELALARQGLESASLAWDAPLLQEAQAYILISGLEPHSGFRSEAAYGRLLAFLRTETAQGKPLLGLGQGAAFIVENGLVPGLFIDRMAIKLLENKADKGSKKAIIRLSDDYQYNAYTRYLSPKIRLESRLNCPSAGLALPPALLAEVVNQGLNVFSYCDAEGQILPDLETNPAGSAHNIAALSNKAGNVLALFPELAETGMDALLLSLKEHLASGFVEKVEPLYYWPRGV